jgi:hypothetical protein
LVFIVAIFAIPQFVRNVPGVTEKPDQNASQSVNKGIYIEKVTLPDAKPGAELKMMPLIVYKGHVYIYSSHDKLENADFDLLKGSLLGTTKGNIDEWSSQEDYAKELASTIGVTEVYAVKGYDTDFRIMTYDVYSGVQFFDCVNGIYIDKGGDLFGKMKLKENVAGISYQTYDDWSRRKDTIKQMDKTDAIDLFIDKLYEAQYIESVDLNGLNKVVLSFSLKDGSAVDLILFEGAYVKYAGINSYGAFKMDMKAFNNVYDLVK